MKDILQRRFNSILKEINYINDIILKETKEFTERKESISKIYSNENSKFDSSLEKLILDQTNTEQQYELAIDALNQLVPRSIELYNIIKMSGEDPEYDDDKLKINFLQLKERMGEGIFLEDGKLIRDDSHYKEEVEKARKIILERLKETFEEDKKKIKDAQ